MIRVFVADDHAVVREGLKRIIAGTSDIVVSGEASNGQEVLDYLQAQECDLVVLDISMPNRSGLDVLKQLKREWPKLPVLVLSIHSEEEYGVRTLKAGASGYLTKECAPDQFVEVLRKIASGRKFVGPSLAEKLAIDLATNSEKLPHERLSSREYQVFCLIAMGRTVKQVAGELRLSVKTVSTHRVHILEKMSMKSSVELIHYAIQRRLVEWSPTLKDDG